MLITDVDSSVELNQGTDDEEPGIGQYEETHFKEGNKKEDAT